jgi:hypothetical protein
VHRQIYACKRLGGIALSASQFVFFAGGGKIKDDWAVHVTCTVGEMHMYL